MIPFESISGFNLKLPLGDIGLIQHHLEVLRKTTMPWNYFHQSEVLLNETLTSINVGENKVPEHFIKTDQNFVSKFPFFTFFCDIFFTF